MEVLRQYVVSVTAAAILCGVVLSMTPKETAQTIVKMICGLFLAFTVMRPLSRIDLDAIMEEFAVALPSDAAMTASYGENLSREAMAERIKAETEAYILDKAAALNVTLEAEVTLSGEDMPLPVSVTLHGDASPYAKQQLTKIITEDLGISKENQLWTG